MCLYLQLSRLNGGNLQQVGKIIRDMACESDSGLWCVTLRRFLAQYHNLINVSKLYASMDTAAYNATAVRQVSVFFSRL